MPTHCLAAAYFTGTSPTWLVPFEHILLPPAYEVEYHACPSAIYAHQHRIFLGNVLNRIGWPIGHGPDHG